MEFPEGRGVYPGSRFWKIQRGGGVIGKIPSVEGGYGYFLEPHIMWQYPKANKVLQCTTYDLQTPFQTINSMQDLHLVTIPSTQTMFPMK